ncbi:hypothetical protein TNIN_430021 [Trichonephila inaurata madagascariensis]|uniref:Speckle-type POZ protein n=1 Tax=Trichonephila inaurata madagascariensis TaxID=2747483 RepID=A0A8X7BRC8_9ARAC|nr:hypothetical protein TNIN_430021 [Trichonephila inaurata madagascariensis]
MDRVPIFKKICFTYSWSIENFNYSWKKNGEYILSPDFIVDNMEKTKWRVALYPKGRSESSKDIISVDLIRGEDRKGPERIIVYFEFSILATDGSVLVSTGTIGCSFAIGLNMGFDSFVKWYEVLKTRVKDYLPGNVLTVRCTMWNNRIYKKLGNNTVIGSCFARTRIGVERRSFMWNIKQFNSFQESIYKITSATKSKPMITLKLFPSSGQNSEIFIRVKVYAHDRGLKLSTFHMYVVDISRKRIECLNEEILFDEVTNTALFTLTFSKEQLMMNQNRYLPNDILQLYCECVIVTGIVFNEVESVTSGISPEDGHFTGNGLISKEIRLDAKKVPIENLETLYKENLLCDTKLKTKSGSFPAHKNILSARSPVFKAMFNNMKEKHSECVDIEDLDDDTVKRMLLYMYTVTLPDLQWDSACNLYTAAHKYEILSLKSDCTSFLMDNLTLDNACDLLILANRHQDKDLKSAIQNYFSINRGIFNTNEWKCFMQTNAQLSRELL